MVNPKQFETLVESCRNNLQYSKWFNSLSLKDYTKRLLMEVDEVINAVENDDRSNLIEELGDIFWMITSLIVKSIDKYDFSFDEVISTVLDKFKRRKPHIFDKKDLDLEKEVEHWHKVKSEEKLIQETS